MSESSLELELFAAVGVAARGITASLGRDAVCAVLFWGDHTAAEVVQHHDVPEKVLRALTTSGGRCVADEIRGFGGPLKIRGDALPPEARELSTALRSSGLASLVLVPLFGEAGVVGSLVVPFEEENPSLGDLEFEWLLASRALLGLQLAASTSALRTILQIDASDAGDAFDGVLVLDRWERVILADGLFRAFPGWNREDPFGRSLDGLPGVRILSALPVQGGLAPAWEEHLLPPIEGHGIPVALAAVPFVATGSEEESGRIILLRDLRAERGIATGHAPRLLGLGMRVAHAADQVSNALAAASVRPGGGSGGLGALAVRLASEIEEASTLLETVLSQCLAPEHRRTAQLNELLQEVLARYKHELELERVRIFTFLRPELPRVAGDPLALLRAVRLLVQSARASLRSGGGSLTVRSWLEEGWVYAAVSDDGAGRTGHDEERVGQPLFAVAEGAHQDDLLAVRSIVEECGGKLIVESRPNVWTRNTLMIREERRRTERCDPGELPASVDVHESGDGLAVLIVDDNAALRSVLRRYLERRGHSVTEAVDGEDGLRVVTNQHFDRVIVDVQMPGKTGPEFFEGLRVIAPAMRDRTIFMTGGFLEGEAERFIVETGRPSIKKPFDLAEMARTVEGGHENAAP